MERKNLRFFTQILRAGRKNDKLHAFWGRKFLKLRISPIPPVNMDQLWTTSEVLLRPNRQKSLHYLAIVTSYPIKSSHNMLLNLREFVKWSRKRNSMRKIDTNNDIFLAAMLRSGGIPRTGSAYTGFTHSMARDRNFEINVELNTKLASVK